jgi:putative flippase GtrA
LLNILSQKNDFYVAIDGAIANIVGYLAGMINSFILNKIWTFKAKAGTFKQAYRFIILNIICLILSTAILYIFVDLLLFPYILVWFTSITVIMTLNFLGNKYWTFPEQSNNAS